MSALIQAEYGELMTISRTFARCSQEISQLQGTIDQRATTLIEGAWQGQGVTAFASEMEGEVRPAMLRLTQALDEAAQVTMTIAGTLKSAEEEAAALFQERSELGAAPPANDMASAFAPQAAMRWPGMSDAEFEEWLKSDPVPAVPVPELPIAPIPDTEPPQPGTHDEGAARLREADISIKSSGNCSDKSKSSCTSLDGMQPNTLDRLIQFKKESGLPITVTGGTETGHSRAGDYRHDNGYKVDIAVTPEVDNYIKTNYEYVGIRASDGARQYRDKNGNIYARETKRPHWDITYNK